MRDDAAKVSGEAEEGLAVKAHEGRAAAPSR